MRFGTLTLTCTVKGSPAPTITWLKRSGLPADFTNNRTTIVTQYNSIDAITTSVLAINLFLSMDVGDYVCEANNSLSEANLLSNITVDISGQSTYVRICILYIIMYYTTK